MTTSIIVALCILLLIAYVFDLTAGKTRVPSVILLLLLGWGSARIVEWLGLRIPDLTQLLPIFGTVGLILIVLEGALELELNRSKFKLIKKSFVMALVPMLATAFVMAYVLSLYGMPSFRDNLLNAIPFAIISSAIAIPSAKNLPGEQKEFVVYESSLSDILGVLLFNFVAANDTVTAGAIGEFGLDIIIIIIISVIATAGLAVLMNKIDHHIKFAPIILLVILIYEMSKILNLPGLVFILLFGLALGNLDELKKFDWIRRLRPEKLDEEVRRFKYLTLEATFIIRAVFFILFGFLIKTSEILNLTTLPWAFAIVGFIMLLRFVLLKLNKVPLFPLLFIAPRGLITVLLFFAIGPAQQVSLINQALIIQVIILLAFVMMTGMMMRGKAGSEGSSTH